MSKRPDLPPRKPYASADLQPPFREVFVDLRARWVKRYQRTFGDLAERLGAGAQSISQWGSGSDPTKRPPLWALVAIADDLGLSLVVTGDGIEVIRRRRKDA